MQGDGKQLKTTEFVMNKQKSRKASPKRRKRERPERDELDFSELKPKKKSSQGKKKRKFRLRTFFVVFAVVIVVVAVGFGIFVSGYYRADENAVKEVTESDLYETVKEGDDYFLFPAGGSDTGVIFYPGGNVEQTAYLPIAGKIAEKGFAVSVLSVPFNLAIFDPNGAERIIGRHPEITEWYVGGHSLGGSMASMYAENNSDKLKGLFLFASYSTVDLSDTGLKALAVYGTEDGIMNHDNFEKYQSNLPAGVRISVLQGGNHSQFGNYGLQDGDGKATISSETQQDTAAGYIYELIAKD